MNLSRLSFTVLGLLVLANQQPGYALADKDEPKKDKPKFTVSKETTFVTGPLDKDGYIDYAAALNKELGKGITPKSNANVLLWKSLGSRPEGGKAMPADYFKLLGIEPPPERGDHFIGFSRYLTERLKLKQERIDVVMDQESQAVRRVWSAKEFPQLAEWLKLNEKPLDMVIEATLLLRYFNPLVPGRSEPIPTGLYGAPLQHVQTCREMAKALAVRALLRAGVGRREEAWQDLLTCHRLGRVVSRGATLIELLAGIAIDDIASEACLTFLDQGGLTAKQIQACLRDLQELPRFSTVAEKFALAERFMLLESVMMFSRYGFEYLKFIDGLSSSGTPDAKVTAFLKTLDWDPALKNVNHWCDRIGKTLSIKNHGVRARLHKDLTRDIAVLRVDALETGRRFRRAYWLRLPDKDLVKLLSDLVLGMLLPGIDKVQHSADRNEQTQRNLQVAFALAAFNADKGSYPKELSQLVPKYIPEVPNDLFSGKALLYRPEGKGYLLYSVGPNGEDDGGRCRDDDPPGDDLRVRVPLPELKRSE